MRSLYIILGLIFTVFSTLPAQAEKYVSTDFTVYVKAKDAKFIGTGMGGALVTITDKRTGDILATGKTHGGTSGSDALMADSVDRKAVFVSKDSAKYDFSIDLIGATPVTITAKAPLAQAQSLVEVSYDMVLVPGKDYSKGNGIIIEMPGFSVDILTPPVHAKLKHSTTEAISFTANIVKLCGCHISEDTPWPPENYEVDMHIYKEAIFVNSYPMKISDKPGIYSRNLILPEPGTYRVEITAFDPYTKEGGVDTTVIVLEKGEEPTKKETTE